MCIRVAVLLCCLFCVLEARASVLYVDANATGAGTGLTWQDAYVDLQDALLSAQPGDEVWVAAGRYVPSVAEGANPRLGTFLIPADVRLYGGFAGDEVSRSERAGLFSETILSGDVAGDDEVDFENRDDNTRHVVSILHEGPPSTLDGFVVSGGYAGPVGGEDKRRGAGLVIDGAAWIEKTTFRDSRGSGPGAGACLVKGAATFLSCVFEENRSGGSGAGLGILAGDLVVASCRFADNHLRGGQSRTGGAGLGVWADGSNGPANVHVLDSDFEANVIEPTGGTTVGVGLSLISDGGDITCLVENSRFCGNILESDGGGGGVGVHSTGNLDPRVELTMRGCTIDGNRIERAPPASATYGAGLGVICNSGRFHIDIRGTSITNNRHINASQFAAGGGVAIYDIVEHLETLRFVDTLIGSNLIISDAEESLGGGLFVGPVAGGDLEMVNVRIAGNRIVRHDDPTRRNGAGGGLWTEIAGSIDLHNVEIVGNHASDRAAGLLGEGFGMVRIANCTVAGNRARTDQGGLRLRVGPDSAALVTNSIFWGNVEGANEVRPTNQLRSLPGRTTVMRTNIEGGLGELTGSDNYDVPPVFADPVGPDGERYTGDEDVRLSALSPCVDAGDAGLLPADLLDLDGDGDSNEPLPLDRDGNARMVENHLVSGAGALVDLGAFEYPLDCPGDVDGSRSIDLPDLAALLDGFGAQAGMPSFEPAADLRPDGRLDLNDLAAMLSVFGASCP